MTNRPGVWLGSEPIDCSICRSFGDNMIPIVYEHCPICLGLGFIQERPEIPVSKDKEHYQVNELVTAQAAANMNDCERLYRWVENDSFVEQYDAEPYYCVGFRFWMALFDATFYDRYRVILLNYDS